MESVVPWITCFPFSIVRIELIYHVCAKSALLYISRDLYALRLFVSFFGIVQLIKSVGIVG